MQFQSHDLLHLNDPQQVTDSLEHAKAPLWVVQSLLEVPWVVVRRAVSPQGMVSVGVRGSARHERYPAIFPIHVFDQRLSPEQLVPYIKNLPRSIAAVRVLHIIQPFLTALQFSWGPTGSIGFQLATAALTVTCTSDCDLIIRIPDLQYYPELTDFYHRLHSLDARVDCLIETPLGAIALAEFVSLDSDFLLRTPSGPQLIAR